MNKSSKKLSMVVWLCLIASLCFIGCGNSKESSESEEKTKEIAKPKEGNAPKIVALQASFDFGDVKQGKKVEHIFKIRNDGTADLIIEKAKGS